MNVVFHTADLIKRALLGADVTTEQRVQPLGDIRRDPRLAGLVLNTM